MRLKEKLSYEKNQIRTTLRHRIEENLGLLQGTRDAMDERMRISLPVELTNDFMKQVDMIIALSIESGIMLERGGAGETIEHRCSNFVRM